MAKCSNCGASGLTLKIDSRGLCPSCHDNLVRKLEERIAALETQNEELRAFHDEYQAIPDAKAEAARLIGEANANVVSILGDASSEAYAILTEAKEEAERIRNDALAAKNSIDADIAKKLAKAESKKNELKRDSHAALAYVESQIAAVLAAAAQDFAHLGKSSFAQAYSIEQKHKAAASGATSGLLTTSQFRKAAKRGYIVFDLETTGLNRSSDKIIEIGAIKFDGDCNELQRFQTLVNPGRSIPTSASAINHIYDSMVTDAPAIDAVLPEFMQFIGDLPLVAHNAAFDIGFLCSALDKCNIPAPAINYGDTLAMSRKAFDLPSYKLGSVAEHLGVRISTAHRSIGDCETLSGIVRYFLDK